MLNSQQLQQEVEKSEIDQFAEKIEKAKKLYALFNGITFGDKIESAKSRIILNQII